MFYCTAVLTFSTTVLVIWAQRRTCHEKQSGSGFDEEAWLPRLGGLDDEAATAEAAAALD